MSVNKRELLDKYETLISPAPRFAQVMEEGVINFATDVFSGPETAQIIKAAADGPIYSAGCAISCAANLAEKLTSVTNTDAVLFAHDDISALICAASVALDYSDSHYGQGRSRVIYADGQSELDSQGACALVFSPFDEEKAQPFAQDYFKELFIFASENDLITIADERAVGFMRTGAPTVCMAQGLSPDITIVGGLGGGLPLTLCLMKGEAAHSTQYGAQPNPIICTVANSVLSRCTAEGFGSLVSSAGERLCARLSETGKFEEIGFCGLYISAKAKNPHLRRLIIRKGLLCGGDGECIVFKPPLDVTDGQIDRAIEIIMTADER